MQREFRLAKGWRIFMYVLSPVLIAVFAGCAYLPFTREEVLPLAVAIVTPTCLAMMALFTYGIVDTIKGKIIFQKDSLTQITAFRSPNEIRFDEIKGYRADGKYLHIIRTGPGRNIKISTYTENCYVLENWAATQFENLDSIEATMEEIEVLKNDSFGITQQARENRLREARRVCLILNIAGGICIVWAFFPSAAYTQWIWLCMLTPLLSIAAMFYYRGMIRIDQKNNSSLPNIAYGIVLPSVAIPMRAVIDFEILNYENLWVPVTVEAVLLVIVIVIGAQEITFKKGSDFVNTLIYSLIMLAFAFGSSVMINGQYDESIAQTFDVRVIDKDITSGKTKTYYFVVDPWGPRTMPERVDVTQDEYERTTIGDTVKINLHSGYLNVPWFFVSTKD